MDQEYQAIKEKAEKTFYSFVNIRHGEKLVEQGKLKQEDFENAILHQIAEGKYNKKGLENAGYGYLLTSKEEADSLVQKAQNWGSVSYARAQHCINKLGKDTVFSELMPLWVKDGTLGNVVNKEEGKDYSGRMDAILDSLKVSVSDRIDMGVNLDYTPETGEKGFAEKAYNWLHGTRAGKAVTAGAALLTIGAIGAGCAAATRNVGDLIASRGFQEARALTPEAAVLTQEAQAPTSEAIVLTQEVLNQYTQGLTAFDKGDYESAHKILEAAMNAGLDGAPRTEAEKKSNIAAKLNEINASYAGQGKFFHEGDLIKYNTGEKVTKTEWLWNFARNAGRMIGLKLDDKKIASDSGITRLYADKNYDYTVCTVDELLSGNLEARVNEPVAAVKHTSKAAKKAPVATEQDEETKYRAQVEDLINSARATLVKRRLKGRTWMNERSAKRLGRDSSRIGTPEKDGNYTGNGEEQRWGIPEEFREMLRETKQYMPSSELVEKIVHGGSITKYERDKMQTGLNQAAALMDKYLNEEAVDYLRETFERKIGFDAGNKGALEIIRELKSRGFQEGFDFNIPGEVERKVVQKMRRAGTLEEKIKALDKLLHEMERHRDAKLVMTIMQTAVGLKIKGGGHGLGADDVHGGEGFFDEFQ